MTGLPTLSLQPLRPAQNSLGEAKANPSLYLYLGSGWRCQDDSSFKIHVLVHANVNTLPDHQAVRHP